MEQEQFYSFVEQSKQNKNIQHPIDKALFYLEDYMSFKWFKSLFAIGVTYLTPCAIVSTQEQWATYSNFGYNTILIVSAKGFSIISNYETLTLKGKIPKYEAIFKDKKHKNSLMIVFKHSITLEQYYKEIL